MFRTLWAPRLGQEPCRTQIITGSKHFVQYLINGLDPTGINVPAVLHPLVSLDFNWKMTMADHCTGMMV